MRFAYLIHGNGKFFPIVFNKEVALANAKHHGMNVYRMPYQYYKGTAGQGYGWDCPTFILCSEQVYTVV